MARQRRDQPRRPKPARTLRDVPRLARRAPVPPHRRPFASRLTQSESIASPRRSRRSTSARPTPSRTRRSPSSPCATFLEGLVLPLLREVGDRWERSEASTAQEHFASSLIRGRLLSLGRGWGSGSGPLAMLACPSGERHDLGLVSFGLLLHERGWRIAFFGQDTPAVSLADTARFAQPEAVVVSAVDTAAVSRLGRGSGLDREDVGPLHRGRRRVAPLRQPRRSHRARRVSPATGVASYEAHLGQAA